MIKLERRPQKGLIYPVKRDQVPGRNEEELRAALSSESSSPGSWREIDFINCTITLHLALPNFRTDFPVIYASCMGREGIDISRHNGVSSFAYQDDEQQRPLESLTGDMLSLQALCGRLLDAGTEAFGGNVELIVMMFTLKDDVFKISVRLPDSIFEASGNELASGTPPLIESLPEVLAQAIDNHVPVALR